MKKMLICFSIVLLAACNGNTDKAEGKDEAKATNAGTTTAGYNWSKDEENQFLSGCVDSAKVKAGEEKAFAHCNCVLTELKKEFPNMDSAANALMDGGRAAEFAKKCQ